MKVTLQERLDQAGIKVRSYSGRGMYGKECLGAVAHSAKDVYAECGRANIKTARVDSMGLGVVVYWPSVAWVQS
jgi:hypothetical protein